MKNSYLEAKLYQLVDYYGPRAVANLLVALENTGDKERIQDCIGYLYEKKITNHCLDKELEDIKNIMALKNNKRRG